jgi:hypothetical protein
MNFNDKIKIEGHLQIVKVFSTGEEEVLHDDSNVITGGLGRSIAQFMTTLGCDEEKCGVTSATPPECHMRHYQISRFQVGQGASAQPETSAVKNLGLPLTDAQYGGVLRSVEIEKNAWLWADDKVPVGQQDFGLIRQQGSLTSSLVTVWSLDPETANGTELNEAGLFVENPYLYDGGVTVGNTGRSTNIMVGGTFYGVEREEQPPTGGAHLLAAYKHFETIRKESYFSLLFRWAINFSVESP